MGLFSRNSKAAAIKTIGAGVEEAAKKLTGIPAGSVKNDSPPSMPEMLGFPQITPGYTLDSQDDNVSVSTQLYDVLPAHRAGGCTVADEFGLGPGLAKGELIREICPPSDDPKLDQVVVEEGFLRFKDVYFYIFLLPINNQHSRNRAFYDKYLKPKSNYRAVKKVERKYNLKVKCCNHPVHYKGVMARMVMVFGRSTNSISQGITHMSQSVPELQSAISDVDMSDPRRRATVHSEQTSLVQMLKQLASSETDIASHLMWYRKICGLPTSYVDVEDNPLVIYSQQSINPKYAPPMETVKRFLDPTRALKFVRRHLPFKRYHSSQSTYTSGSTTDISDISLSSLPWSQRIAEKVRRDNQRVRNKLHRGKEKIKDKARAMRAGLKDGCDDIADHAMEEADAVADDIIEDGEELVEIVTVDAVEGGEESTSSDFSETSEDNQNNDFNNFNNHYDNLSVHSIINYVATRKVELESEEFQRKFLKHTSPTKAELQRDAEKSLIHLISRM